ncbi:MAG: alpha/beta hydrolase [Gemmatimonadota bacterium]
METRDATLSVQVGGGGPDLLLVHGLSAHGGEWEAVTLLLEGRFRVIVPDLAGRGESACSARARFGLAEETERLLAVLASTGSGPPLVAGHSHGAALAVSLARRTECRGLILLNPVTPWTARPAILGLLRLPAAPRLCAGPLRHFRSPLTRYILTRRVYADAGAATEDAVDRYAAPFADPARARALVRALADWRPAELAVPERPLAIPAHVVAGRLDRRTPVETARRWAVALGARFTVLEDCAHGIPEEEPDRVARWIAGLDESRSGRESRGSSTEGESRDEHQE